LRFKQVVNGDDKHVHYQDLSVRLDSDIIVNLEGLQAQM